MFIYFIYLIFLVDMQVVYLGDTGKLFTTGFSKFSDREYAVWADDDLSSPLKIEAIDSSSGAYSYLQQRPALKGL